MLRTFGMTLHINVGRWYLKDDAVRISVADMTRSKGH